MSISPGVDLPIVVDAVVELRAIEAIIGSIHDAANSADPECDALFASARRCVRDLRERRDGIADRRACRVYQPEVRR